MSSLLLALLAAALATLGGREAVRVARLSAALGGSAALLAACWFACVIAGLLAARLGAALATVLAPDRVLLVAALAMLLAAAQLLVLRPVRAPSEPTRSFGAVLLVLGVALVTTAPGLVVFALAAIDGPPWLTAVGGTFGSAAVLSTAWKMAGAWDRRMPLGLLRYGATAALLAAALLAALAAVGLL